MKRARTQKPRIRRGRSWPEILSADPRDPDVVRAKALTYAYRVTRSRRMRGLTDLSQAGGLLDVSPAGYGLFRLEGDHNPDLAARYAVGVIEIVDDRAASDAAAGARR